MASQFQIGDVVQLKSGGPAMTVVALDGDVQGRPLLSCTWYEHSKSQYEERRFFSDNLVPIEA